MIELLNSSHAVIVQHMQINKHKQKQGQKNHPIISRETEKTFDKI
jgi:hypothetical protein